MKLHDAFLNHTFRSMTVSSKSFMRANSRSDIGKMSFQQVRKMDRLDSLRGSTTETFTEETFGPLSNVRFAVFALGSSAYPNFCAYGKYVDNILGELGGERLMKISYGDEMCGQEHAFRKWAPDVFKVCWALANISVSKLLTRFGDILGINHITISECRMPTHAHTHTNTH